ncbi:unnamed protein product [Withania somnifera]
MELPILLNEDELISENDGCSELELKGDEVQTIVSDGNSKLGLPVLLKEDQLTVENDGCSELELKGDELVTENDGCGELELKGDKLKVENDICGEVEIRGLGSSSGGSVAKKSLDEFVKEWVERKVNAGLDKRNCVLPFLVHAAKSVCYVCNKKIHLWRCIGCPLASHDKCAAFLEHVVHLNDQPGSVICWKHPSDLHLEKHGAPTSNLEEIFANLPLPYVEEEFKIDINWNNMVDNRFEPPPYVHIKRNVYLIKKKRDGANTDIGCTNCRSTECLDDCVCRVQCISCSKACRCSDICSSRPFRRDRKIKLVKLLMMPCARKGYGTLNTMETIFYMCELRKGFTIDATFKGNLSRFLNHSCDPNCKLEKWQVEGETRVGVFAAQSIEVGEALTYDYKFVQFGPEVKCHCGASNCQGYLGSKKKITSKLDICWGLKRKRTSTCLAIIKSNSC